MLLKKNIPYYLQLMRVDKPIGSLLLLWPTLWALWLARSGVPDFSVLIIFLLGIFIMRSAGCVINDIADRNFDRYVERTKDRPLTSGKVTLNEALCLLILLLSCAFSLALFLKVKTTLLSIPALLIALSYPYMKRYHSLPQAHLGVAFSFGIPMAFMEIRGSLPLVMYQLMFVNICWTLIYDTQYAMSDREDDKKIGVKSSALFFESLLGDKDYYIVIGLQVVMLLSLVSVYLGIGISIYTLISVLMVIGLFSYHIQLIKDHDPHQCFKAFKHNNWVGLTIFISLILQFI